MSYQVLAMDIDGTLRPFGSQTVPAAALAALQAVQRAGVRIVVATGRGRVSVPGGMLGRLRPDAWLCAAGAEVLGKDGRLLAAHRLTAEEMYALVDFFEDYDYPLRFQFSDGNYVYVGYAESLARHKAQHSGVRLFDGEDQDRHLQDMPYSAFGCLPQAGRCAVPAKIRLSRPALSLPQRHRLRHHARRGGQGHIAGRPAGRLGRARRPMRRRRRQRQRRGHAAVGRARRLCGRRHPGRPQRRRPPLRARRAGGRGRPVPGAVARCFCAGRKGAAQWNTPVSAPACRLCTARAPGR